MRFALAILTAALAAAGGCGDDTTMTAAGTDLAAVADLSVPVDLAQLSCDNILVCRRACGQNHVCQQTCRQEGTTAARASYDALLGCLAEHCADVDGGTKACSSATDASAGCLTCLATSFDAAIGTGAACHTEYATCAGG